MISPFQKRNLNLLKHEPHTEFEHQLQKALAEAEARDEVRKQAMVAMQSATILQNAYVTKVNGQLHAHEEESEKKKNRTKKFDGSCKLLTSDDFFGQAVEAEEKAKKEAQEKEERKARRENYAVAVAKWKKQEEWQKERNVEVRQRYHEAVKQWEEERDLAKAQHRCIGWPKPKMGKLEGMIAQPKLGETVESEEDNEEQGEDDDDGDEMSD